jgi:Domain of unknown function (DUF5668)
MDCVNHSGVSATAYCQNCGKALCAACVRTAPGGQIFCEPCWTGWQSAPRPFVAPPMGAPSPGLAAFLGLIPGVGAMYNGQFLKGLVHVVIFAVLVSASHVFGLFGLLIAGWVFYQVFDAYHTAKARRDGEPLPDPLGLNDVGRWFGVGGPLHPGAQSGFGTGATGTGPASGFQQPDAGQAQGATSQAPFQSPYQQGAYEQPQWQTPYQGPLTPGPGTTGPGVPFNPGVPPNTPGMPPISPMHWRRREPIGAVILIALGLLFLMGRLDLFSGRAFEFGWPVLLIGLGVWLIVRRMQDTHGSSQGGPK